MWPLGPDIVEECNGVSALELDNSENWSPVFEPTDFNEAHGPLKLQSYRLSTDELRDWAERTVKIRVAILERAKAYADNIDEGVPDQDGNQRSRSQKKSKAIHNIEQRSEKDLKQQGDRDKGMGTKLRKRHRRELSADEIADIVAATKKPYCQIKDVALQHRVTPGLVGRLVKDAEKNSQMIQQLRDQVEMLQQKRDAVEQSVVKMLVHDKPIVRAQQISSEVQVESGLEVKPNAVRRIMRKELHMGYRMAKPIPIQGNSERCLVLRQ